MRACARALTRGYFAKLPASMASPSCHECCGDAVVIPPPSFCFFPRGETTGGGRGREERGEGCLGNRGKSRKAIRRRLRRSKSSQKHGGGEAECPMFLAREVTSSLQSEGWRIISEMKIMIPSSL